MANKDIKKDEKKPKAEDAKKADAPKETPPKKGKEPKAAKGVTSPVLPCSCVSKRPGDAASFQDKTYGVGRRVHTVHGKMGKSPSTECTVCGSKKS